MHEQDPSLEFKTRRIPPVDTLINLEYSDQPLEDRVRSAAREIVGDFTQNYGLAFGGEVVGADGRVVRVGGVLEQAIQSTGRDILVQKESAQRIASEFPSAKADTKGRWRLFNITFREPDVVRDANKQRSGVLAERKKAVDKAREPLILQLERINDYLESKGIETGSELSRKLDHLLAVEEFLDGKNVNLDPIIPRIIALNWPTDNLTHEKLSDYLIAGKGVVPGYEGYKKLVVGENKGETRVPGLRDFEKEAARVEDAYQPKLEDVNSRWAQAKERAGRYDVLQDQLLKNGAQVRRLEESLRQLRESQVYLADGFVPDENAVVALALKIHEARKELDNLRQSKLIKPEVLREARSMGERDVRQLKQELENQIDPVQRILRAKAPTALAQAAKRVASGVDSQNWTQGEESVDEILKTLIGRKGLVLLPELKIKQEENDNTGGLTLVSSTQDQGRQRVIVPSFLSGSSREPEQDSTSLQEVEVDLTNLDREQIANLMIQGKLTLRQLTQVPVDDQAQSLKQELLVVIQELRNNPSIENIPLDVLISATIENSAKSFQETGNGLDRNDLLVMCLQSAANAAQFLTDWCSQFDEGRADASAEDVAKWRNLPLRQITLKQLEQHLQYIGNNSQEALIDLVIAAASSNIIISNVDSKQNSLNLKAA